MQARFAELSTYNVCRMNQKFWAIGHSYLTIKIEKQYVKTINDRKFHTRGPRNIKLPVKLLIPFDYA